LLMPPPLVPPLSMMRSRQRRSYAFALFNSTVVGTAILHSWMSESYWREAHIHIKHYVGIHCKTFITQKTNQSTEANHTTIKRHTVPLAPPTSNKRTIITARVAVVVIVTIVVSSSSSTTSNSSSHSGSCRCCCSYYSYYSYYYSYYYY
jgi:hypothetical protein